MTAAWAVSTEAWSGDQGKQLSFLQHSKYTISAILNSVLSPQNNRDVYRCASTAVVHKNTGAGAFDL